MVRWEIPAISSREVLGMSKLFNVMMAFINKSELELVECSPLVGNTATNAQA